MIEHFCQNNEQPKEVIFEKESIIDVWQGSKYATVLHFKKFSIQFTLHEGRKKNLAEKNCWAWPVDKISKFQRQKNVKLNYSSKYISLFGSSSNIKRIQFFHNPLGTLLLKLIYWNKSIQRANIIITTKWTPRTAPENNREIPNKTSMRRNCDRVNITLWHECFPKSCLDIVTGLDLQILFWNLSLKTSTGESLFT